MITNYRGITLVEVMASILLFSITIVAILSLIVSNAKMGKRADEAYIAYNLAKNHIEEFRSLNFSDLSAADEADVRLDELGVPDPDGAFSRTTTVVTPYESDDELAQVTVQVSYDVAGQQSAAPVVMSSVIFGGG